MQVLQCCLRIHGEGSALCVRYYIHKGGYLSTRDCLVLTTDKALEILGTNAGFSKEMSKAYIKSIAGWKHPTIGGSYHIDCIPAFLAYGGIPLADWCGIKTALCEEEVWPCPLAFGEAVAGPADVPDVPLADGPVMGGAHATPAAKAAPASRRAKGKQQTVTRLRPKKLQMLKLVRVLKAELEQYKRAGKTGRKGGRNRSWE